MSNRGLIRMFIWYICIYIYVYILLNILIEYIDWMTPHYWYGVSNHKHQVCLLSHSFRRKSKKTSKFRVTGLRAGNSPGTGEFPAQMASNAENVSIWWHHHVECNLQVSTIHRWLNKYGVPQGSSWNHFPFSARRIIITCAKMMYKCCLQMTRPCFLRPPLLTWFYFTLTWISNHMPSKV